MNTKFIAVLATAGVVLYTLDGNINEAGMLVVIAIIWIGWFFSRKND
jgi:hypothetical protein